MELVSLWVVCMAVTTVLVPLAGVIAGIIIVQVKKDKGWYLLTLVCGALLIWALAGLLRALVFGGLMGFGMGYFGLFPVPN